MKRPVNFALSRQINYLHLLDIGIIATKFWEGEVVDAADVRRLLLAKLGLRVEPEMSRYLASRLEHPGEAIAIMGGDARTGTPLRRFITPLEFSQLSAQQGSP